MSAVGGPTSCLKTSSGPSRLGGSGPSGGVSSAAAARASTASSGTAWVSTVAPHIVSGLGQDTHDDLAPYERGGDALAGGVGDPQTRVVKAADDAAADHANEERGRGQCGEDQTDAGGLARAAGTEPVLIDLAVLADHQDADVAPVVPALARTTSGR
jgi:hypothetical protein